MIIDGIKVSAHTRRRPHSEKIAETTLNLIGYARTERCKMQEAALNRMAPSIEHEVERDVLAQFAEDMQTRVREGG